MKFKNLHNWCESVKARGLISMQVIMRLETQMNAGDDCESATCPSQDYSQIHLNDKNSR